MPTKHSIKSGDSVSSLAQSYGLFEQTIWQHSDNATLKALRPNMNILAPGDEVVIPDLEAKKESKMSGVKHRFKRKGVPSIFRVQLFQMSSPRANQNYIFDVDGKIYEGVTDADGVLKETVSPSANIGHLTIGPDNQKMEFQFGTIEPLEQIKGVIQRLMNIGFYDGKESATKDDPILIKAIKQFQVAQDLPSTGELDQVTVDKLALKHDKE